MKKIFALLLITIATFNTNCFALDRIDGAGGTFTSPIMNKWIYYYRQQKDYSIHYQAIGSGEGIDLLAHNKVDFASTDYPIDAQELKKNRWLQFPIIIGGIAPVYRLDNHQGQVKLTGPLLAKMMNGTINFWDNPAIQKLNPNQNFPHTAIAPIHRESKSGSTFIFTSYLASQSPSWAKNQGKGPNIKWPKGIVAKGNSGIAASIGHINGGLGYIEYTYALKYQIPMISLKNKAGLFVSPNLDSFTAAAKNTNWQSDQHFANNLLINQKGPDAWPITASSYLLLPINSQDSEVTAEMIDFVSWAIHEGKKYATRLKYVPLDDQGVSTVLNYLKKNMHSNSEEPQY